jgi:hypothetical protein
LNPVMGKLHSVFVLQYSKVKAFTLNLS